MTFIFFKQLLLKCNRIRLRDNTSLRKDASSKSHLSVVCSQLLLSLPFRVALLIRFQCFPFYFVISVMQTYYLTKIYIVAFVWNKLCGITVILPPDRRWNEVNALIFLFVVDITSQTSRTMLNFSLLVFYVNCRGR